MLLWLVVWLVYRESPVEQVTDAHYTVLATQALLDGRGLVLDAYLRTRPGEPVISPTGARVKASQLPYQLEDVKGHLRLRYPVGSAVLSVPLLAIMRPFGYAAVDSHEQYDPNQDRRINRHLAPFLAAVFVLLVYLMASEILPVPWATAVTLVAALASPAWSTLSRGLWSHVWLAVLVAAVIYHLVRAARLRAVPNGFLVATLLWWAYFTRPTAVLVTGIVALYLWRLNRRQAVLYAATSLVWGGLLVAWSWNVYGRVLPPYYFLLTEARIVDDTSFPVALAGALISPSRGLLVFCPWILVLVWLLWRHRRLLPQPALVHVAWSLCVLQALLVAAAPRWWGGWSYGPRLLSDMFPWLMALTVFALSAWLAEDAPRHRRRRTEAAAMGLTVMLAVGLHAPGALSERAFGRWNRWSHADLDKALWDWSHPQFLAWIDKELDVATHP